MLGADRVSRFNSAQFAAEFLKAFVEGGADEARGIVGPVSIGQRREPVCHEQQMGRTRHLQRPNPGMIGAFRLQAKDPVAIGGVVLRALIAQPQDCLLIAEQRPAATLLCRVCCGSGFVDRRNR